MRIDIRRLRAVVREEMVRLHESEELGRFSSGRAWLSRDESVPEGVAFGWSSRADLKHDVSYAIRRWGSFSTSARLDDAMYDKMWREALELAGRNQPLKAFLSSLKSQLSEAGFSPDEVSDIADQLGWI